MLEHFAAVWASPNLPHINTTEFATLVGAVEQWQHTLSPASVTNFLVDNRTAIAWARRLRAPAGLPQSLALRLAHILYRTHGRLAIHYINTLDNALADLGSRFPERLSPAIPLSQQVSPPTWLSTLQNHTPSPAASSTAAFPAANHPLACPRTRVLSCPQPTPPPRPHTLHTASHFALKMSVFTM